MPDVFLTQEAQRHRQQRPVTAPIVYDVRAFNQAAQNPYVTTC